MRYLLILLCFSISPSAYGAKGFDLSVAAEAALIMNAKTGQVLFEKNGYDQSYPASTTKIATALLALYKARTKLEMTITADRESVASISPQAKKQSNYRSPAYWVESDSTHIGIKRGETFRLYDLLHGMLLASGNDAANVIAQGLGESIPKYMDEVNVYLKGIGCKNTHFNNPHGLHHPDHYTTPYDLALMAKAGLKDPLFRQIVSTVRYVCPQTNLEEERTFIQTNQLLKNGAQHYPKAIGVKTGYTQVAGKNLVAAARTEERELIVVALGYRGPRSELYSDVIKMFEMAFNEPKMRRTLLPKGEQKLTTKVVGARGHLKTYLAEPACYDFYPSEEVPVKIAAKWNLPPLPIAQGACVGYVRVLDEQERVIQERPLLALEAMTPTFWHRLSAQGTLTRTLAFAGGALLLVFFLLSLRKKRPSRSYR